MGTITATQAMLWSVILLPLNTFPLVILTRKGCTAEINVIWYAFSLVFVIWWSLNAAMAFSVIELPLPSFPGLPPGAIISGVPPPSAAPWTGRYFFEMARYYLTDVEDELGLVVAVVVIAIAPQLLTYVLSGLSGCASTPKLVWQFEKIAIWSLIKFLPALGGFFAAVAADVNSYNVQSSFYMVLLFIKVEALLRGLTAVAIAFVVTVMQVYFLEFAHSLGEAWQQEPKSWPFGYIDSSPGTFQEVKEQASDEAYSRPEGRRAFVR